MMKNFYLISKRAAGELHPKFIALVSSPIPFMNGTDFPALSKVLETETGIPAFAVPTNGMHDYVYGAGKALEEIARRFVPEQMEDRNGSERTVNLLGATPLDFGPISKVEELKKNLEQYGWKIDFHMGDGRFFGRSGTGRKSGDESCRYPLSGLWQRRC